MTPDLTARGKLVILIDDGGFEWEDVHAALDAIEQEAIERERVRIEDFRHIFEDIPSDHGLFIADVREHKPYARLDHELIEGDIHDRHRKAVLFCSCGWVQTFGPNGAESYFDHIAHPDSTGARE